MTDVAAVLAAVLFIGMAAFQLALTLGAPVGGQVLGGATVGDLPGAEIR